MNVNFFNKLSTFVKNKSEIFSASIMNFSKSTFDKISSTWNKSSATKKGIAIFGVLSLTSAAFFWFKNKSNIISELIKKAPSFYSIDHVTTKDIKKIQSLKMKDLTPQQIYDYNHYSAFFTTEQIQSLNKAQTKKFYPVNIEHIQYLTTDYLTTNQIKSYSNHFTGKQISQFNEAQTQNFFPSYPQRIESRYNFSINQIPYLKTEYLSPRQVLDYYDLFNGRTS